MTAHERIQYSRGEKLAEPMSTTAGGFIAGTGVIGILAFVYTVAMNPAISRAQMTVRLLTSIVGSVLFGPMLLELLDMLLGIKFQSLQSQLAVCLIPAAFLWLVLSIISHQLERWNNSKNPIREISRDVRDARRGIK